ncbi:MAG: hypothetical protein FWH41_00360 [Treponema sp.]|nr:hypothetical protein [Treponema sp.]
MLVVNGFLENGVFVPENPLSVIEGRQKAVLRIEYEEKNQERMNLPALKGGVSCLCY